MRLSRPFLPACYGRSQGKGGEGTFEAEKKLVLCGLVHHGVDYRFSGRRTLILRFF